MPHFDAASAECLVFTYKEGLLSAIAHDLEIRVQRFDVDVDDATLAVRARFDAASLKVVAAVRDGAHQPGALGDADKLKIEHSLREDALHTREHPEIRFASSAVTRDGARVQITGELSLHGRTKPLTLTARTEGDRLVAEARLHQPDFGIKPYSAMLGTLKIKPGVLVRCSLPLASLPSLG